MDTIGGRNYPEPPEGVSRRAWGRACDEVAREAWLWGRKPDYDEALRLVRDGVPTK